MPTLRKLSTRKRAAARDLGRKTRITIRLGDDVLDWFRRRARAGGGSGYQTLIDLALRDYIAREPLEATLRRVIRVELARAEGPSSPHAYEYQQPLATLVADNSGGEYGASLKRRRRRRPARKE